MSKVHLLDLPEGTAFRLTEGGPVFHRAPDSGETVQVTDSEGHTFAARHLLRHGDSLFVLPLPQFDRRSDDGR